MTELKLTEGAEPAEVHPMRCAPVFDVYTASSAGPVVRWPVLVCAGPPAPEPRNPRLPRHRVRVGEGSLCACGEYGCGALRIRGDA
jgi:hypothetical protein